MRRDGVKALLAAPVGFVAGALATMGSLFSDMYAVILVTPSLVCIAVCAMLPQGWTLVYFVLACVLALPLILGHDSILAASWTVGPVVSGGYTLAIIRRRQRQAFLADEPKCPQCGYVLYYAKDQRCPECGRAFTLKEVSIGQAEVRDGVLYPVLER